MRQLLQSVSKRTSFVAEVPAPAPRRGEVLVRVMASLISAGTEKTAVDFAEKNLLQKARSRPDLFRQVVDKARREGVLTTWETVRNRLGSDLALGYSNAGIVLAVGDDVQDIQPGDPVACAGGGYASHAEVVRVPRNLVAPIPQNGRRVAFEDACFTTVASIAMHGFRLAEPQMGENVAVIGLGLVGLLLVQIAKTAGCNVLGMDPNPERCRLAKSLGCDCATSTPDQLRQAVLSHTNSHGADAVLITAATPSNGPVQLAGELARRRGKVIVVGAVGLQLPRQPFYDKELSFRISCSYGPGRYDSEYEEKGHDYPIGFVRWTENRNMQAVLQMMSTGKLDVKSLITHRFPIAEATRGYDLISGKTHEPFLGIVIQYPDEPDTTRRIELPQPVRRRPAVEIISVGLIGVGNFATGVLLPAMKKTGALDFVGLSTGNGATAYGTGSRLGFRYCTTDSDEIFHDGAINTVVIATRHDSHARLIRAAIEAGKNVFCEKPLCTTESELAEIAQSVASHPECPLLMIGFNRRFSPMGSELKKFVSQIRQPLMIHYRINAGYIPANHWTQDPQQGAGRIIGEVCHFVDFCSYLTGSLITSVQASKLPNSGLYSDDNLAATLTYEDGSVATITYVANGDKSFGKERVEVFCGGSVAVLDDFRSLTLVSSGRRKVLRSRFRQDKGHAGEWMAFASALRGDAPSPISFEQIANTTLATFKIVRACLSCCVEQVDVQEVVEPVSSSS